VFAEAADVLGEAICMSEKTVVTEEQRLLHLLHLVSIRMVVVVRGLSLKF
jgi:hypothetical protein